MRYFLELQARVAHVYPNGDIALEFADVDIDEHYGWFHIDKDKLVRWTDNIEHWNDLKEHGELISIRFEEMYE